MHRQQEVCEFLCHFLERAQPAAFCGRWEARLINPHVCVESGSLLSPLPLEVAGGTISAVIQNWHRQHAVFALESSAGILLLQLKRYNLEDGAARKNMTRIACRPGELVRVPHFRGSQGLEVAMLPYRVAFVHQPARDTIRLLSVVVAMQPHTRGMGSLLRGRSTSVMIGSGRALHR